MNKIVLILLFIGMLSCTEKKPERNSDQKQAINQTTQIVFDTEMHDFGKVKSGEILSFSFVFTNSGKADLIINKTETDCGCIQAKIPKEPIPQGARGIIEVEFNSAGMFGKQLKTIEIQSNSKETKHLIIFAEVENEQIEFRN